MITVSVNIKATLEKIWEFWNNPNQIQNWYLHRQIGIVQKLKMICKSIKNSI